jgi:hypothetical protein
MKVMILHQVPGPRHKTFVAKNFLAQRGHDLELLRRLWKENRCESLTEELLAALRTFRETWSTNLRYEVGGRKTERCCGDNRIRPCYF